MEGIITLGAIIFVTAYIVRKMFFSKNDQQEYHPQEEQQRKYWRLDDDTYLEEKQKDWTKSYQKTHLLTKNEYHEYKKLKHFADQNNLIICPKVRLLDLIVPRENTDRAALGKISSKHVDFAICDDKLYVKGIVEIDDNSHKQQDRKERYKFVDSVLTSVGYKVVHTYSVTEETLNCFIEKKEEVQ